MPGVGHDYIHGLSETVNPANGSLSVRINLPVPKGRGLTLPFALTYDSGEVHHFASGMAGAAGFDPATSESTVYATNLSQQGFSWATSLPYATASYLTVPEPLEPEYGPYGSPACGISNSYNFYDSTGGPHMLGLAAISQYNQNGLAVSIPAGCTDAPITPSYPSEGPDWAYSQSGGDDEIYAQMDAACDGDRSGEVYPEDCNYAAPAFNVFDTEGNTYSFPANGFVTATYNGNSSSIAMMYPAQIEDRNGNIIQFSSTSTGCGLPIIDTAGRTLVSATYSSGRVATYTVGGLTYTIGYSTAKASYTVGVEQIESPPSGVSCTVHNTISSSFPVISSITLPNGQAYSFAYDDAYGLVSKITYPDGGWVSYTWGLSPGYSEYGGFFGNQGSGLPVNAACSYMYQTPVVLTRQVGYTSSATPAQTQQFTYATNWTGGLNQFYWATKTTTIATTDNVISQTSNQTYDYTPIFLPVQPDTSGQMGTEVPVESSISYTDWESTTAIATVTKTWADQPFNNCATLTKLLAQNIGQATETN